MNEHLSEKNGHLAKQARELMRNKKIKKTWTKNYRVFVRTYGESPEQEKVLQIREEEDLLQFGR